MTDLSDMEMSWLWAQRPMAPVQAFDIADGFAITLIFMLFLVLGGFVWVARQFRQREQRSREEKAVEQLLECSAEEASSAPQQGRGNGGKWASSPRADWEREGDWWKDSNDSPP